MSNWKIDNNVFDGYPYCYNKQFATFLPVIDSILINRDYDYVGLGEELIITIPQFGFVEIGDRFVIEIYNSNDEVIFDDEVLISQDSDTQSLSYTISQQDIQDLVADEYSVQAFINRNDMVFSATQICDYSIYALPNIQVNSLISDAPNTLQKPVTLYNNDKITIDYEVIGANGINAITNTFRIDNYMASETLGDCINKLIVSSSTTSSNLYNVTINFTVTGTNFQLNSFKFKFEQYSTYANVNVRYSVDGIIVQDGTYPMGVVGGTGNWVEYIAPTPIPLTVGSHSIQIYNSGSGYWRLFSTAIKPTSPDITFISTTLYAMEMVYSVREVAVAGEHSIQISIDDDIEPSEYPLQIESQAVLKNGEIYDFENNNNILEVLAEDNLEIDTVSINKSGRYVGSEIDIIVSVAGLDYIEDGDIINIILRDEEQIFFQYSDSLSSGQTIYSYEIEANHFTGLSVGDYTIVAKVTRGLSQREALAAYSVIEAPSITLINIAPNTILLPFTTPITIQTYWQLSVTGVNTTTGTINIFTTPYYGSIDTEGTNFNIKIHNITSLAANSYALSYNFTVVSNEYGSKTLTAYLPNILLVLGEQSGATDNINFDAIFPSVENLSPQMYSLDVKNLHVISNEYGTITIDSIYDDVLTATENVRPKPKIDVLSSSIIGRYIGKELDNTITVTILNTEEILESDTIKIELYDDISTYYTFTDDLIFEVGMYSCIIPAIIFEGLSIGAYDINATVLRNAVILDSQEITYGVIEIPSVELIDISQDYIQLPIYTPLNIVTTFSISGDRIDLIKGELEFDNKFYSNYVNNDLTISSSLASGNTELPIAIRNIYDILAGFYSISTQFSIHSDVYGDIEVTEDFNDIINVPNIITQGIDTKYTYDLILCKPNKQQIAFIEAYDIVFNPMFLEYNKLTFGVYREIVTEDGSTILNPVWRKILSDFLVLLNIKINDTIIYTEYFVIENPSLSYDGLDQLSFQAYSYEKIFMNNENLSGFKDSVKRLYDVSNSTDDDGLPHGFLNYILKMKWYNCWTLRYIDATVLERERVLSFTGNNMKYVIDTLEESFNCVFVFDNMNMIFDIYERSIGMLGNNKGLVVADDNIITTISYQEDTTSIRTRVTVFGKNGATIAKYNPTGQLYVDDFSYYTNLQYMSQGLINALNTFNVLVASKDGIWTQYCDRLDAGDESVIPLVDALREELAWKNNFTNAQIKELTPFIKEETVTINTISNGRELYRYSLRHIKTTAFVPIQISVEVLDVFALEEHQKIWLKFRIGDFANIYRKEYDLEYKEMRLISYEHNPIKNTLRLEFSNKDELITMQWLNNMFFYQLENLQTTFDNERDYYLEIPEFNFEAPELIQLVENIVDNSIQTDVVEYIDNSVINNITEVFETQVLSAETAHILNAWIRYLCVNMLETNFDALDLRMPSPPNSTRYFIRIEGMAMQYIESTLSLYEVENYVTPLGDQIYWTAINDHAQAYKYFTITDPINVYPDRILLNPLPSGASTPPNYVPDYRSLTDIEKEQIRETFRVKVRKTLSSSIRKTDAFEPYSIPGMGTTITIPKTIWGSGDEIGRGRGFQYKDWDNFYTTYITRVATGDTPAGTEIGIRLNDDGCWYYDIELNEWRLIGSGEGFFEDDGTTIKEGIEEAINSIVIKGSHIIIDHLPTQAEINIYPLNSVVLVYDPGDPYVPAN